MDLSAVASTSSTSYVSAADNLNVIQNALQTLQRSLGTGNLTAAQSAFTQLQQANQHLGKTGNSAETSTQTTNDIAALGTALSSGDLDAARTAFSPVKTGLANINALSITAAIAAANQAVQQIDILLGQLSSTSGSATSVTSLLGSSAPATPDIAAQTTGILSSIYGNHTPATPAPTAATGNNINVSA